MPVRFIWKKTKMCSMREVMTVVIAQFSRKKMVSILILTSKKYTIFKGNEEHRPESIIT